VPQTVYVPVPQYVTPPATTTDTTMSSTGTTDTPSTTGGTATASTPETQRAAGLLDRSRGILSTVMTGFRGILDDSIAPSARKTLLGE
jgi:hypothetical protein